MRTHNIGFYEDLTKLSFNYHQISSNMHLISSSGYCHPNEVYSHFYSCKKNENFQLKKFDIFLTIAQNIHFGYMLDPPRSNEYPQSMF